ncbi:MAG TPA: hypothetical protein VD794_16695 [Flavisolibacter sp.]|nr:hypothetical protein [Flavisolibacter sp.]
MQHEFENLNYFELHTLLVNKNREFTDGLKAGKKHAELQVLYNSIHEVYTELRSRKFQPVAVTG